jgi:hypothetical protein
VHTLGFPYAIAPVTQPDYAGFGVAGFPCLVRLVKILQAFVNEITARKMK